MKINWINISALLVSLWGGLLPQAAVADSRVEQIPLNQSKILLDGKLDEQVWQNAQVFELSYETSPGENLAAPQKTLAYLFEDSEHLFIGFKAFDDAPGKIRAYLSDRDKISASDRVVVKLDTFNDSRRAFLFAVNPLGIQADSIIDERTERTDSSWDAIWHSAGQLTADGFSVEIQIPLNALRFEDKPGKKTWGVQLTRIWPRQLEHTFSNVILDRHKGCQLCQFAKVEGFANASPPTNITLIPALTLVNSNSRAVNPTTLWDRGDVDPRVSLDMRWGVSQNNFLNMTLNPDFSQVEADALQLDVNNLTTVFLEEKRAFFLDGADLFDGWSNLVYSRIFEEPEYGLKATGKSDAHSYGVMVIEDKHTNFLISNEYGSSLVRLEDKKSDNQIFRYRYDLGEKANIGTTITHRTAEGYENTLVGVDGKFWLGESDFIKFQAMSTDSDYPDEVLSRSDVAAEQIAGDAFSFNYTHRGRNWNWLTTYHRFGEDFRPDSGFVNFSNWERFAFVGSHTWYSENKGTWWNDIVVQFERIKTNEIDGTGIDDKINAFIDIQAIYQSNFGFFISDDTQTYIAPTLVNQPQTEFDIFWKEVWLEFQPLAYLDVALTYIDRDEIDYTNSIPGKSETYISDFEFQLSDQTNIDLQYISKVLNTEQQEVFEIDLINFRLSYQISEKSLLKLTLQSQELELEDATIERNSLASQLIYSYKANPFTLFYFGYSDRYKSEDFTLDLKKAEETLFMKFSYAWQL